MREKKRKGWEKTDTQREREREKERERERDREMAKRFRSVISKFAEV